MTGSWKTSVAATTWAACLVATGSLAIAGVWDSWVATVVLLLGAVLPLVLLRVVVWLGVPRWPAAAVLTALLVLTAYLMTAGTDGTLVESLGDAVPRLLTEPLPYAARADLLTAPLVLVALVSLLAGLRLDARTRVGPVAGAVVLYVAGALLSAGATDPHGLLAVLLVALAVAGWVLLDHRPDDARRRIATGLPVVAGLAVVVAGVALVPVGNAFEPRDHVDAPVLSVELPSPLPRLGAWAANPDAELFRVQGDPVPLRLVTLRDYDGTQWQASTRYSPLGSPGEKSLPDGRLRQRSDLRVQLDALGGPWLPTPGDPVAVSARDAAVDLESGTVYDGRAGTGTRYDVTGVADAPDPDDLLSATVPTGGDAAAYLRQPELPLSISTYGARITRGAGSPYETALAIESAVSHNRKLTARAASGSAFWRIEQFLFGEPGTPGARTGTSEQFATAFALLARDAGLPTRLVVGFGPGDPDRDGTLVVHGRDALAWPEVYFDGLGWVPFNPTPTDSAIGSSRPTVAQPPVPDSDGPPAPQEQPTEAGASPQDDDAAAPRPAAGDSGGGVGAATLALGAGATVLVLLLLVLALRRLRSVRHLRRGAPGAWAEVLDTLALAGVPVDRTLPATDLADAADARFGTSAARTVADSAERTVFGPGGAEPSAGDRLRTALADVRRAARSSVPAWRRWWWWVDPRVLLR
ncbi:transglutaminase domain-containing protein [Nocardioides anomalus]|uniref:Transglutaminase domain-containing protein n=1 Tax=Nocardioides anomalus TaxID=2712223 RepID=A0A6G6WAD4_9ACTN|nr:transglutaminase domain-containing protein [Nocardioides anomalus]QIG42169.1 transglutaminase domain-containing protein [Nocardioides anomalus]